MADFNIIGKPVAMVDAASKTTGAAHYTDDLSLPGMLIGKILHSPYPHARIKGIDVSRALALDGVIAVVTGKDAPTPYSILPSSHDEHALALEKVRHVGDNVACVAAVDEATAESALEHIKVDYELLPAYFDPEDSMRAETDLIHENKRHNIEKHVHQIFGNVEQSLAESDYVAERRYIANEVTHAAIEPHSTLAWFEPNPETGEFDRLNVWSSTQVPYYLRQKLALVLNWPLWKVRVIKPFVGGGFGGKSEIIPLEIIAAVAARAARAPVKITYRREEVFWAHRGRPRTIIDLKTGVSREGRIKAVKARVVQDGGAYCGLGPVTLRYSGASLDAIYDIANMEYDGYRVLTNKPASGPMRGHGTVNIRFAFESQLDEIAVALHIDPAEIRRRNLLRAPCVTAAGFRVLSYGLPECVEKVVEHSGWKQKKRCSGPARGLGLAASHYLSGASNSLIGSDMAHSTVKLQVDRDGGVLVYTGAAEIGQGSDTMTAQIAAEVLGCSLARVKVISADSDIIPIDLGSYSSRVTFMAGNATLRAAEEVKTRIASLVGHKMNCAPEHLLFRNDMVYEEPTPWPVIWDEEPTLPDDISSGGGPSTSQLRTQQQETNLGCHAVRMTFTEAVRLAIESGGALMGTGSYSPPIETQVGHGKGGGVGSSPAYSYCAQVAEVSVDEETGQVTVRKIWAAHDCGRALNPVAVKGQIIGSVAMGLGQALQEELIWKDGMLMNPGLLEYHSPSTMEIPNVEPIIVESFDPGGPFGAKECGEGALAATIPAIANAIFDAVGVRLRELPFTPERVLAALRARRDAKRMDLTCGVDPTAPRSFREPRGWLLFRNMGPKRHPQDAVWQKKRIGSVP